MKSKTFNNKIILALLVIATIFSVFPIVWMATISIRPNLEVFQIPPKIIPDTITFSAYSRVFHDNGILRFFLNSYIVAISVTVITIFISLLAAYGFSRFRFRGKKVLNYFIIVTQTIPPITLLIPYFSFIVAFKLFNTYTALIITYCGFTLPYSILMLTGYFNGLSIELDEAVQIDGGSRMVALFKILTPLALPGIVATSVYTFLLSWNEYLFALTLTKSTEMRTIPIGISLFMGQQAYEWNIMMAMSVAGSIPILILYMFSQKYFIAGMTAGAVKS